MKPKKQSSRVARGTLRGGCAVNGIEWPIEPILGLRATARIVGISAQRVQEIERNAIRKIMTGLMEMPGLEEEWRSIAE